MTDEPITKDAHRWGPRRSIGRLQHDDRDLALGPSLVAGVARVGRDYLRPQVRPLSPGLATRAWTAFRSERTWIVTSGFARRLWNQDGCWDGRPSRPR